MTRWARVREATNTMLLRAKRTLAAFSLRDSPSCPTSPWDTPKSSDTTPAAPRPPSAKIHDWIRDYVTFDWPPSVGDAIENVALAYKDRTRGKSDWSASYRWSRSRSCEPPHDIRPEIAIRMKPFQFWIDIKDTLHTADPFLFNNREEPICNNNGAVQLGVEQRCM
jgi:hypothetical protein